MKLNSEAGIAQARRDLKRYGSWFGVFEAATRRDDGVLVLPPDPPANDGAAPSAKGFKSRR